MKPLRALLVASLMGCGRGWCDADCASGAEVQVVGSLDDGDYEVTFGKEDLASTCWVALADDRAEAEAGCPFTAWSDGETLILSLDGQDMSQATIRVTDAAGTVLLQDVVTLQVEWREVCERRCREASGQVLLELTV